ncbi:hypothetical protein HZS_4505 [Henneguya salminicola]|nr:hypothetical protein HZS_4505 [Henneguya salminicola]
MFTSTSSRWSPLYIEIVETDRKLHERNTNEFIAYGDTIRLICPKTNLALPNLVQYDIFYLRSFIRLKVIVLFVYQMKISHNCIEYEFFRSLMQIALAIQGEENTFLCIENDEIKKREIAPETNREIELPESACWSVVATGNFETNYIEPSGFSAPVTPTPKVIKIEFRDKNYIYATVSENLLYEMNVSRIPKLPIFIVKSNGVVYKTSAEYYL